MGAIGPPSPRWSLLGGGGGHAWSVCLANSGRRVWPPISSLSGSCPSPLRPGCLHGTQPGVRPSPGIPRQSGACSVLAPVFGGKGVSPHVVTLERGHVAFQGQVRAGRGWGFGVPAQGSAPAQPARGGVHPGPRHVVRLEAGKECLPAWGPGVFPSIVNVGAGLCGPILQVRRLRPWEEKRLIQDHWGQS